MGKRYTVEGYEQGSKENEFCEIIDHELDKAYTFAEVCSLLRKECTGMGYTTAYCAALELIDELCTDENVEDDMQDLVHDYARPDIKHKSDPLVPPCCN